MKFFCLSILLISCILGSCELNKEKNASSNVGPVFKVEYHKCKRESFNNLFKIIKIIPLQTDEKSIIGGIRKVIIEDSLIFIHDKKQNKLFVFDLKGNFLKQIGKRGPGPGEYKFISDICLDRNNNNNNIYIYDGISSKLFCYNDTVLNKVEKIIKGGHILKSGKGTWIYMGNRLSDKGAYNLLFFSDNKIKGKFCPFPLVHANREVLQSPVSNFMQYGNKTLFSYYFSNRIYSLGRDKIFPYLDVDFGSKAIELDIFEKKNIPDLLKYLGKENKLYLTGNIFNAGNSLIIGYNKGYILFSEKKCIVSSFYDKKLKVKVYIAFAQQESSLIYCFIDPESILNNMKDNAFYSDSNILEEKLNLSDNPLLVIYHYED